MRSIAIIPARLGSKRIPRKNLKLFHGKPIIAHSIEMAIASCLFDAVYVSTESDEIAAVATQYGASVMRRDASLADDITGTQEVMRAALECIVVQEITMNHACCIYATAPLLRAEDLRRGRDALLRRRGLYAVSVGTDPYLRDAGGFYWGEVGAFIDREPIWSEETVMVPLPQSRVCDINTEADWQRAEEMYSALERIAA